MKWKRFKDTFNMGKNTNIKIGIFIFACLFIVFGLFSISRGLLGEEFSEEIKNVEIMSEDWDENDPAGGSWHINKSADWTGNKKIKINFELETIGLLENGSVSKANGIDALFVVDTSGSMVTNNKIGLVKQDIIKLSSRLLSDPKNRAALISFNTTPTRRTDFTNNLTTFTNSVNSMTAQYGWYTNYAKALRAADSLLASYTIDPDRILIMIFLTDGIPEPGGQAYQAEYRYLKQQYPNIVINGIQYDFGRAVVQPIIDISDYQYLANISNLYEVLFESYSNVVGMAKPENVDFEKFIITDYIAPEFKVESKEDINVSVGTVDLIEENGKQKVIWYLTSDTFKTGSKAIMSIDTKYIGDSSVIKYAPTNEKEEIVYKVIDNDEKSKISNDVPVIRVGYDVLYDFNYPSDCEKNITIGLPATKSYAPYDNVVKSDVVPVCNNYIFRGWEITDETKSGAERVNDDIFVMPKHDVVLKGTWGISDVSKSMNGEVKPVVKYIFDFTGEEAYLDNTKSPKVSSKTGINFGAKDSNTNGTGVYVRAGTENDEYPIFYYRGDVNNNVIFAGFCWKIVRSTETGGVKLLYNGVPSSSKTCENTGTATQVTKAYGYDTNNSATSSTIMKYMPSSTGSSTTKIEVDNWYSSKMTSYTSYLEDTIWCNDMSVYKNSGGEIYFGTYGRNSVDVNNSPNPQVTISGACPNQSDRYTLKNGDNDNGNKMLSYPVGLLTIDEVVLAGPVYSEKYYTEKYISETSYLYTGQSYWTMSPGYFKSGSPRPSMVHFYGSASYYYGGNSWGIRPVISLKLGIMPNNLTTADGSKTNPYIVS